MPANPSRVRDVTEAEGLLGTDRVMDIVERVAQREAKRMTERYGPNVLGIAAASRRRGAKQVKRRAEPVVRFVVREKLDEDALEASGYDPIPRTLPTRTLEKGRWIRIAIPTDVVQPPRLRLHAGAKPVRTYVRVSTDDIRAERGSICCSRSF